MAAISASPRSRAANTASASKPQPGRARFGGRREAARRRVVFPHLAVDQHVAPFAGRAVRAAIELAVDHDAAADAGAQRQREVVAHAGGRARPAFGERDAVAVVLHHHRHAGTRARSSPSATGRSSPRWPRPRRRAGPRPRSMMPSVENAMPAGAWRVISGAATASRRVSSALPSGSLCVASWSENSSRPCASTMPYLTQVPPTSNASTRGPVDAARPGVAAGMVSGVIGESESGFSP